MSQLENKSPVSFLQKYASRKGYALPKYDFLDNKTGRNVIEFYCKLCVYNVSAVGSGTSKIAAKHDAAIKALELLGVEINQNEVNKEVRNQNIQGFNKGSEEQMQHGNFVGELHELCAKLKLAKPSYIEGSVGGSIQSLGQFKCQCEVGSFHSEATASRKKEARQLASKIMLQQLKNSMSDVNKAQKFTQHHKEEDKMDVDETDNLPMNVTQFQNSCNSISLTQDLYTKLNMFRSNSHQTFNYIGKLNEVCTKLKLPTPKYTDAVHPASKQFECICTVEVLTTQAVAARKQDAKHLAARNMLDKIKEKHPFLQDYDFSSTPQKKCPPKSNNVPETLKRKMYEKRLSFDKFQEYFQNRSKENLRHICTLLEISYYIEICDESPVITQAVFDLEPPLTVMAVGTTIKSAEVNLMSQIYNLLDIYMGISNGYDVDDDDDDNDLEEEKSE